MNETKDLHSVVKPSQLSGEGWKQISKRVYSQLTADHISIVAAGVAFYFFLALIPTFIAAISKFLVWSWNPHKYNSKLAR